MKCYNCGKILSGGDLCVSCGVDVTVFKKIVKISNSYYNVALKKASIRDLTGAVDYLKRSIHTYKKNITARNLLGLIFFEMGDVVEALSEWVLSKNIDPLNNPADRYISAVQKDQAGLEIINQTIKKYNIALSYAEQGSDDLAMIQLKKVLNTNQKFMRGHQLLALLFIKNKDYENARKALKKSLRIDATNTLSLTYLREVEDEIKDKEEAASGIFKKKRSKKNDEDRKSLNGNDVIIPTGYKDTNQGAATIIYIIIGILIGAAMVFFIVTPAKNKTAKAEYEKTIIELEESVADLTTQNTDLTNQVSTLTEENSQYEQKVALDTSMQTAYDALLAAQNYFKNNDYLNGAAEIVKITSTEGMTETFMAIYNQIYTPMSTYASNYNYNTGMNQLNSKNYDAAIQSLSNAFLYNPGNANALLNLAVAYNEKGDLDNATKYFNQVIELFPNTSQSSQASGYLNPTN